MNRRFIPGVLSALAIGFCIASVAPAQTRPAPQPGIGSSPLINADKTVTFRLYAPNAQSVAVTGSDFSQAAVAMTKNDAGMWSVIVGPLKPDIYSYSFTVDGLVMPDPYNNTPKLGPSSFASQFILPGPESDYETVKNVPHGRVTEVRYHSNQLNLDRRFIVYTPPGYDPTASTTYPVIYLLHGAGDDETGWTNAGYADIIMDNAIAAGNTKPALIVMPNGSIGRGGGRGAAGGPTTRAGGAAVAGGPTTRAGAAGRRGGGGGVGGGNAAVETELLENIIPLVEKTYRVSASRDDRAIVGLSMGGGQALSIGLNHLDKFSYLCAFSAAVGNYDTVLGDSATVNKQLKYFFVGVGDKDNLTGPANRTFNDTLTQDGVTHTWELAPGYWHQWPVWRMFLHENLPKLFQ